MSTTMVSVTVIDSDGASDIAAPAGTTVAGLCAMLAIDLTEPSVRLSYADGRPLSGGAVLGRDLAAGSVIALSSRVLSAQQVNEASARQENQWLSPVLALVGFSFLLLAAASALCLLPTLGDAALRELTYAEDGPAWARAASSIPVWARGLCALVCMIGATTPLFRSRRVRSHPIMLLLLPALVGYSMIGLVPLAGIHALSVAPVVGVWSALIVTLAVASLTGTPSALSAIIAWGAATLLVTIHAYPLFALIDIAPLAVMIGVLLFLMSPRLALRVPDNQLIDSASLQTIASRIRQPPASAPSTLTGERIATVLSYTSARNTVLLVAASLFVLVGGIPLAHTVTPAMSMGRGLPGFILVIAAITALLTVPRATRSHAGRILPRLCAASLACAFLFGAWVQSWSGPVGLYPMIPVAILVLVGVAIAAWANLYVSKGYAALVGTILDAVQNFSIFTLPPAAVVASGLFAFAWSHLVRVLHAPDDHSHQRRGSGCFRYHARCERAYPRHGCHARLSHPRQRRCADALPRCGGGLHRAHRAAPGDAYRTPRRPDHGPRRADLAHRPDRYSPGRSARACGACAHSL